MLGDWETVATMVAQRLLNTHMDDPLVVDGKFGDKTFQAVKRFQRSHPPLKDDGVVGPKTFEALGLKTKTTHEVRLHAQRKGGLCWAAAAAMMRGGKEPPPGEAKTEKRGSLVATDANVRVFA